MCKKRIVTDYYYYYYYHILQKDNNADCSSALKNEQHVIFTTDQHTGFLESLDDCPLTGCFSEDVIKNKPIIHKENGEEFDIVFLNKQHQLEIKTITI